MSPWTQASASGIGVPLGTQNPYVGFAISNLVVRSIVCRLGGSGYLRNSCPVQWWGAHREFWRKLYGSHLKQRYGWGKLDDEHESGANCCWMLCTITIVMWRVWWGALGMQIRPMPMASDILLLQVFWCPLCESVCYAIWPIVDYRSLLVPDYFLWSHYLCAIAFSG